MESQLNTFYKTPMEDFEAKKADGIFKFGIPYSLLHPMAEFWLQHPLLKPLRKEYENCKVEKQNPTLCIDEARELAETMNRVAEQPFAKCPKETVGWTKCLDDNARNYFICRDGQVEWERCMKTHFDMKFPPFPLHPRRKEWNAGSEDLYRMRFKLRGRDALADLSRHVGMGMSPPPPTHTHPLFHVANTTTTTRHHTGMVHPETDLYAENF